MEAIYIGRQDGAEKCVQPFAEASGPGFLDGELAHSLLRSLASLIVHARVSVCACWVDTLSSEVTCQDTEQLLGLAQVPRCDLLQPSQPG